MIRRVAAIDCGTNSIRLLIAELAPDGTLVDLDRRLHLTRLGQGVDATGDFHPDALARTLAGVADFAAEIAGLGVDAVRLVATSAARDAGNRQAFFAGVRERLGVDAEIITGAEEARLSFRGAITALPHAAEPVLVMDIGGGSTELVLGAGGALRDASLDIGSVRLRERFLHHDPPTAAEVAAATEHVDRLLDGSGIDLTSARTWIGVGGTATSLSALHQHLPVYDRTLVHGSVLTRAEVIALADALMASPIAQIRQLPTMHPRRADVICAGALIASRVARRSPVDLLVSESDILDGIARELIGGEHAGT